MKTPSLSSLRLSHLSVLAALALIPVSLQAAPNTINYQGKVHVGATPFSGTGQFRFALINTTTGATVWSNDGTSVAGSQPTAAVNLPVTNGLYSVPLGDSTIAGMTQQISAAIIPDNNIALRVWFNNGVLGSQLLTPDQPIAAVAWAHRAAMASSVPSGTINAAMLNAAGTPVAGQILGYNGTNLSWTAPGGSTASGWTLLGNAPSVTTNFLGTTNAVDMAFRANNTESFRIRNGDGDLIFPRVPSDTLLLGATPYSGLGIYGTNSGAGGATFGRTFGPVSLKGPYLYGEQGGGLGVTERVGSGLAATIIQKPILTWNRETGEGGTVHIGGYASGTAPKLIKFGDGNFVSLGEAGEDDRMELTAKHFHFTGNYLQITGTGSNLAYMGDDGIAADVEFGSRNPGVNVVTLWNAANSTFMDVNARDAGLRNINYTGQQTKLDVGTNFVATVRAADFFFGGTPGRRATPGRALVDNIGNELYVNYQGDWGTTHIGGTTTFIDGDASVRSLTIRGGADLAEPFAMSSKDIEPGSVVVIDEANPGKLKLSTTAYDSKVAGIVSGANGINPGISMIQEDKLEAGSNVALSGRVYVKAETSSGKIKPGDMLTTSAMPGHAMKVADRDQSQGAILGKAMTALDDSTGLVLVLVTLQ
jgi:hypothetical protein